MPSSLESLEKQLISLRFKEERAWLKASNAVRHSDIRSLEAALRLLQKIEQRKRDCLRGIATAKNRDKFMAAKRVKVGDYGTETLKANTSN